MLKILLNCTAEELTTRRLGLNALLIRLCDEGSISPLHQDIKNLLNYIDGILCERVKY